MLFSPEFHLHFNLSIPWGALPPTLHHLSVANMLVVFLIVQWLTLVIALCLRRDFGLVSNTGTDNDTEEFRS